MVAGGEKNAEEIKSQYLPNEDRKGNDDDDNDDEDDHDDDEEDDDDHDHDDDDQDDDYGYEGNLVHKIISLSFFGDNYNLISLAR